MNITFQPMTQAQFDAFRQASLDSYTEDLLRDGQYASLEEAQSEALAEFSELLPHGLQTPNHFLLQLLNENSESVGYLWYDLMSIGKAFIDDIYIYAPHRRQGCASAALRQLEAQLQVPHITLHVFESNIPVRKLYEKAGYSYLQIEKSQAGSLYMFKRIR